MINRRSTGACLISLFAIMPALAQEAYPNRPVALIVNVAPGTGADIVARLIAPRLSDRLKQPVVVENKVGASGVIGTEFVTKSAPNGYTLMLMVNSHTMVPWLYKNLPYDPVADLAPIAKIASTSLVLVANPQATPAKDFAELFAYAKANPGKLSYASPGKGTAPHLMMEMFKQRTGVDILHVPHKDSAGATANVVGGHVNMLLAIIPAALPAARAGKLKMFALTGPVRSPLAPDVPTYREFGHNFMDYSDGWYALAAPAKTPADIIARLNQEMKLIMAQPDLGEQLGKQGIVPLASSPEEIVALIKSDLQQWGKVVADAKITAD
ncbi:MAG: Bug family tripartite tricarboxylate transporter substrate binding protein [Burkholderiales bacterium]